MAFKLAFALLSCIVLADALEIASRSATADECNQQEVFDIVVCKSHMCTKCVLAWCGEGCQEYQEIFAGCKCADWASGRESFSGGDFEGKGKFGDVGDYAKSATL